MRKTQKLEDERCLRTTARTNKQANDDFHRFSDSRRIKKIFCSNRKKYLLGEKQRRSFASAAHHILLTQQREAKKPISGQKPTEKVIKQAREGHKMYSSNVRERTSKLRPQFVVGTTQKDIIHN